MRVVVLLSGGIDSMACVHFYLSLGYDVKCLFCNYGQPAAGIERESAILVAKYYNVPLDIIETQNMKIPTDGEICGRNALLVMQGLSYQGFGTYKIVLGIHDGTGYVDCSPQFVALMKRVLDLYSDGKITIEAPFLKWSKAEIVAYCKKNNLPLDITYSCEKGTLPMCGFCSSCLDRKEFLNE